MRYTEWLDDLEKDAPGLSLEWIDAGMVPLEPRGEIRVSDDELEAADSAIRTLELYSNQWLKTSENFFSHEFVIEYKFTIPTITTLKEEK